MSRPALRCRREPPGACGAGVSARSEYDAAYFTLLRAREEHDDLLRYGEYLDVEQARLDAFTEQTRGGMDAVPRRLRRVVDGTTKPLLEAVGRRRSAVLDERRRMEGRLRNAELFVEECELEVARLRA